MRFNCLRLAALPREALRRDKKCLRPLTSHELRFSTHGEAHCLLRSCLFDPGEISFAGHDAAFSAGLFFI
jgi:hypothetical protein